MLSQLSFLFLSQQDHQLSVTFARLSIICSRIVLRTRLTLLLLKLSSFIYMKSSFRRIKRMRKCFLSKITRQKTKDFHQRRDEKDVNFFNDEHVK